MSSPPEQQLINMWAIIDAHRREDPDFKVRASGRVSGAIVLFWEVPASAQRRCSPGWSKSQSPDRDGHRQLPKRAPQCERSCPVRPQIKRRSQLSLQHFRTQ